VRDGSGDGTDPNAVGQRRIATSAGEYSLVAPKASEAKEALLIASWEVYVVWVF
jgi:hypothetical protein